VESREKGDWNTEIEGMQSMAVVITDAYHLEKYAGYSQFGESVQSQCHYGPRSRDRKKDGRIAVVHLSDIAIPPSSRQGR
jgi:hypothetical protein